MIISSRLERRLSIIATAILTSAVFVMPGNIHSFDEARAKPASYVRLADATPLKVEFSK
jgi:hypothetical protein